MATEADYGTYTLEILKTEGFHEFVFDSLAGNKVKSSYLARFDLLVLAESGIDQREKKMIQKYVKNGGNLIAFHPDPQLAVLFGIEPKEGNIAEGYIRIDTTTDQGKALTSRALQFHETADIYTLDGGREVATLFADKVSKEGFPAIVNHSYKKGHTVAGIASYLDHL